MRISMLNVRPILLIRVLILVILALRLLFKSGKNKDTLSPFLILLTYVSATSACTFRLPKLIIRNGGMGEPTPAPSPTLTFTSSRVPLMGAYILYNSACWRKVAVLRSNASLLALACKYCTSVPIFWSHNDFCF